MMPYFKPDLYAMNREDGIGIFMASDCYPVGQVASGRCWNGGSPGYGGTIREHR
jgi:hypothetical protein